MISPWKTRAKRTISDLKTSDHCFPNMIHESNTFWIGFDFTLVEIQIRKGLMDRSSPFESVHVHPCQLYNKSCHSGIVNVLRTQDLAIYPLGNE